MPVDLQRELIGLPDVESSQCITSRRRDGSQPVQSCHQTPGQKNVNQPVPVRKGRNPPVSVEAVSLSHTESSVKHALRAQNYTQRQFYLQRLANNADGHRDWKLFRTVTFALTDLNELAVYRIGLLSNRRCERVW